MCIRIICNAHTSYLARTSCDARNFPREPIPKAAAKFRSCREEKGRSNLTRRAVFYVATRVEREILQPRALREPPLDGLVREVNSPDAGIHRGRTAISRAHSHVRAKAEALSASKVEYFRASSAGSRHQCSKRTAERRILTSCSGAACGGRLGACRWRVAASAGAAAVAAAAAVGAYSDDGESAGGPGWMHPAG